MAKTKKQTDYPTYSNDSDGPDPVDVYVGQRLREQRIRAGISQEKIAECTGVTFQQIQKYEMAKNRVSSSRLYQFSRILGVDISYFFDGFETSEIQKMADGLSDNSQENFEYETDKEREKRIKEEGKFAKLYSFLNEENRKLVNSLIKSLHKGQR